MKAAVFEGIDQIRIRDIPMPEVRPGHALVRVRAAGLCVTDVHVVKGLFRHAEPPCVLGHEVAGEIAQLGEPAWPTALKEGDRVVIETMIACGVCPQCLSGFKNLCENGQDIGETKYQGGYSEYISVPLGCLYRMPDSMTYEEAAIFESFVCPVGGLSRLGLHMADTVLVQGLGPAGLAFVQGARVMGAGRILVSDTNESKFALAREYGADICVNPRKESLGRVVEEETAGAGADVSIEASGAEAALKQSLDLCRKNGKVIFYGIPSDSHKTKLDVTQIIMKQLNLYGSSGAPWAWRKTLELYGRGKFNIRKMVTHEFPLDQIGTAMETLLDPESGAIKIVLKP